MSDVETLIGYICEQVDDACKYAKCAADHKPGDMKLGQLYYKLAKEELNHAKLEEEQLDRLLIEDDEYRMVWVWERKRLNERKSKAHAMLAMFQG